MKTSARVLSSLLILLTLFIVMSQMAVFAAGQDGITLSVETDKDSYESGQEIDVTVTVKNTNDYVVSDVSVRVELPEGLSLVSGDLSISDITLQPGDTYQRAMKAMKSTATDPADGTGEADCSHQADRSDRLDQAYGSNQTDHFFQTDHFCHTEVQPDFKQ